MSALDSGAFPHPETGFQSVTEDGLPCARVYHPSVGLSLRQYAAIHLRVPDSGTPELDAMIRQARRQEMVGRALQGLLADKAVFSMTPNGISSLAIICAGTAIKAMEENP